MSHLLFSSAATGFLLCSALQSKAAASTSANDRCSADGSDLGAGATSSMREVMLGRMLYCGMLHHYCDGQQNSDEAKHDQREHSHY